MARSNSRSLPVALELLVSDHGKVKMLFDRYEQEKESDEETRRALAQRICAELTVHAQLEEELFYPWVRENIGEEEMDLVEEAMVEHASAKDLIAQIEGMGSVDETYDARVKVLGEYVKHHVGEEENELFTQLDGFQDELDELGQEMHARKAELMEEMGLGKEGGSIAMPGARGSKQRSQGAPRGR